MSSGHSRNAELSRAALLVAAGGVLVGMTQRVPGLADGVWGQVLLVAGAVVIIFGLVGAIRTLMKRQGGADQ
ncbi:hypothetical protein [Phenylobacterium sp.]|uniref:hypothetical protein n=1 Tax=Phenylobacterium sp. TaxID=1871053 RepID=UPI003982E87A